MLGRIAFTKNGDPAENLIPVFRARPAEPGILFPEDRVFTIVRAS